MDDSKISYFSVACRDLNHSELILITRMHDEGKTLREIGEIMNPKTNRESRVHVKNPKTGCKRISYVRDDRNLIRIHEINRHMSLPELKNKWNVVASTSTVRRSKKPRLSVVNISKHLDFCTNHRSWSMDDWKNVIFSD
ncbi:hypothetical protein A3Q56_01309 [Intoshia linei]|uniref:Transposase Tc1-like domain-containing protein n=1 Tax=Intoshia linei TaxID=1819745 RepID=A0A177BB85_9BILA|nr:hypothetical protein A3Q56_01309 [Intoshia linei]